MSDKRGSRSTEKQKPSLLPRKRLCLHKHPPQLWQSEEEEGYLTTLPNLEDNVQEVVMMQRLVRCSLRRPPCPHSNPDYVAAENVFKNPGTRQGQVALQS